MDDNFLDRHELLAQVAHKYFIEDMSQGEIAKELNMSRSNISRMLKACRDLDIVEIRINTRSSIGIQLQEKIKKRFNLKEVIVTPSENEDSKRKERVAITAASYLESIIEDGMNIGIAWGTTNYYLVNAFKPSRYINANVVQLMGSSGTRDQIADGLEIARSLSSKLNGNCYTLNTPLIVQNIKLRELLMREDDILQQFRRMEQVDIAIIGIGSNKPSVSALVRAGYITSEETEQLSKIGVVGDICGRQIDSNGVLCDVEINKRVVGIELEQLKYIPTVIGIASGPEKADVILGVLRGKHINVLITDESAAMGILSLEYSKV